MNQRRRFRHAGRGGELSVALKNAEGIENGRLIALGVDFIEAEFPAHVAQFLRVDEEVTVILHALSAGQRVDLQATVRAMGVGEGSRLSAVFDLPQDSSARILVPEMWELCSRASSLYYTFEKPVHAALDFEPPRPEGYENVSIVHLSTLDAKLRIYRTMGPSLSIYDQVRLSFELPEHSQSIEVGGSLSRLDVADSDTLFGTMTFDTTTSDYDVASHVLSRFLLERQSLLFGSS